MSGAALLAGIALIILRLLLVDQEDLDAQADLRWFAKTETWTVFEHLLSAGEP